jgi:LPS-assembly lipoprotein
MLKGSASSRRLWISLLMTLPLVACGFQLRGSRPDAKLDFNSIHLEAVAGSALERDLRAAILAQGNTALATERKSADVTVRILQENQEKKVLTINAQGQVREYSLLYRLRFDVLGKDNGVLLEPTELALQTFMSYSESQALAKETEERLIYNDLRADAISQIMRRLTQVKPQL